jgi:signal peptidase I
VKRVIGLENDLVEIRGHEVLVNGSPLHEPYATWNGLTVDAPYHFGPQRVPAGKVFVLGDNRDNSEDSRMWADPFVSLSQVLGKAVMVYWSSAQDSRVRTVL